MKKTKKENFIEYRVEYKAPTILEMFSGDNPILMGDCEHSIGSGHHPSKSLDDLIKKASNVKTSRKRLIAKRGTPSKYIDVVAKLFENGLMQSEVKEFLSENVDDCKASSIINYYYKALRKGIIK